MKKYIIGLFLMLLLFININVKAQDTTNISFTIKWLDESNKEEKRPESVSIDLMNGDTVVDTMNVTPDEEDVWEGEFSNVDKYDSNNNRILYTVREHDVNNYNIVIKQGELTDEYEYPSNVSNVQLDTTTHTSTPINVPGNNGWKIQEGIQTDFIEGTQVVFNSDALVISNAVLKEYDAQGNVITNQNEKLFYKGNDAEHGASIFLKENTNAAIDEQYDIDHYITLTFADGVTILDGTTSGSKHDVIVTARNMNIIKHETGDIITFAGNTMFAVGSFNAAFSVDLNFKVPGIDSGKTLFSVEDIDIIQDWGNENNQRMESIYLGSSFEKKIYTIALDNYLETIFTKFEETSDGYFRAYAINGYSNDPVTMRSGFVAVTNLSQEGFNIRWTGSSCGTTLFATIKPFKLKTTIDGVVKEDVGGTITDISNWKYRNYGEAKVITVTPNEGYHIKTLKIDGNVFNLNSFSSTGETVLTTGYTQAGNAGTEEIKLYQRENGAIDIYLPAQFYGIEYSVPERTDHWIDVSFEGNGSDNYEIVNTLKTSITGTKTWKNGGQSHISNNELTFTLERKTEYGEFNEFDFDVQNNITWNGDTYTISNLPLYDEYEHLLEYDIEENPVAGYTTTKDGYNFTNTINQQYITVQGTKTWVDGNLSHVNADDIVITLKRNGEELDLIPTWNGNTYKFNDLPKYDDDRNTYTYTVSETINDEANDRLGDDKCYKTTQNGYNFTNSVIDCINVTITKEWVDGNNNDNSRPESITVDLMNGSTVVKTIVITSDENGVWSGEFKYVPRKDNNGNPIKYSVKERGFSNYKYTIVQNGINDDSYYPNNKSSENPVKGTVSHTGIRIPGTDWYVKEGADSDVIAGTKVVFDPSKLNISNATLTEKKGKTTVASSDQIFLKSGNAIYLKAAAVKKLPLRQLKKLDHYMVLTYKDAVTIVDGTANGTKRNVEVIIDNINMYRIKEDKDVANHKMVGGHITIGSDVKENFMGPFEADITFKVPGVKNEKTVMDFIDIDIPYDKTDGALDWVESITLLDGFNDHTIYTLPLKSKTNGVIESEHTKFTSDGHGHLMAKALKPDDNSTFKSGFVVIATVTENGFKIHRTGQYNGTGMFNLVNPFKYKVTVDKGLTNSVGGDVLENNAKVGLHNWKTRNYGEGILVTIKPKDGYHIKYLKIDNKSVPIPVTASNGKYTVKNAGTKTGTGAAGNSGTEDIVVYQRAKGQIDVYLPSQTYIKPGTITVPSTRIDHWIDTSFEENDIAPNYNITNTEVISITGTKTWLDGGKTHDNTNLVLTVSRKIASQTSYTNYNYDALKNITWNGNTYTIKNLPKYDTNGNEYQYKVDEQAIAGYTKSIKGYNITNTINQEYSDICINKTWDDGGRSHNNASHVVALLLRSSTRVTQEIAPISIEWSGNEGCFNHVPKYDPYGYEYDYKVVEHASDSLNNSLATNKCYDYTVDSTGSNFVNKIVDCKSISGTKTWIDGGKTHNNARELVILLKRNGDIYSNTPTWTGNTYKFDNLPIKDSNGNNYTYTVVELPLENYDTTQSGYNFTNKLKQENIEITGTKTWIDGDTIHNNEEEITITLKRNGTALNLVPTWEGNTYKFSNLPKYDDNRNTYTYTVTETINDILLDTLAEGDTYQTTINNKNITNKLSGKVNITGVKTWIDNKEHNNNDDIELTLYHESAVVSKERTSFVPTWEGNTYSFIDLPKYDEQGYEYTYSIEETKIMNTNIDEANYDVYYDIYDIKNVSKELVNIKVEKEWNDSEYFNSNGEAYGDYKRESVVIKLLADNTEIDDCIANEDNNWTCSFNNLRAFNENGKIEYTVTEETLTGFVNERISEISESVEDDTLTYNITITNKPVDKQEDIGSIKVKLLKKATETNEVLEGVVFSLELDGETKDYTTDSEGYIEIEFTKEGTYTLYEKEAPEGYKLNDTKYTITVKKELEQVKLSDDESAWKWTYKLILDEETNALFKEGIMTITNDKADPEPVKIKVLKVDSKDDTKVLEGAVFTLTIDGETKEYTTDSEGYIEIVLNKEGIYKLVEKEAPKDYDLNGKEYTITVKKELVEVAKEDNKTTWKFIYNVSLGEDSESFNDNILKITNTKSIVTPVPPTGDKIHLYIIALVVSMINISLIPFVKKSLEKEG